MEGDLGSWREQAILLGECKWGTKAVNRAVVRELLEKAPLIVPDEEWQVHYALFARAGFTEAASALAALKVRCLLIWTGCIVICERCCFCNDMVKLEDEGVKLKLNTGFEVTGNGRFRFRL